MFQQEVDLQAVVRLNGGEKNDLNLPPDYTRKHPLWYDFRVIGQPLFDGMISRYSLLISLFSVLGLILSVWRTGERKFFVTLAGGALLLGALLGARLSYGLQNRGYFRGNLIELPQIWLGGLTWPGALIGAMLVLVLIRRVGRIPLLSLLDIFLPLWGTTAGALWLTGWGAGIGYGPRTEAWFGIPVRDLTGELALRWPLPLVGAALSAAWTGVCLLLPSFRRGSWQRWRGLAGLAGLLLINGLLSFFRVDPAPRWIGVRWETWISWLCLLVASGMVWLLKKDDEMEKLKLNTDQAVDALVGFIREMVEEAGYSKAVLGVSGGVDSSLSAFLAVRALGPENVLLLRLPYQTSSPDSLVHADLVIEKTGAQAATYDITPAVDAVLEHFPDADQVRRGNVMARMRMIHIYDQSAAFPGLVVGTGNKTETLLGYSTLHGDGAFDFNPLGDLYKAQVRQLAAAVGVPREIIDKPPSADLWVGQTDEDELGFTYNDVDRLLYALVEEGATAEECLEQGFEEQFVQQVIQRMKTYRFKSTPPASGSVGQYPVADLEELPFYSDNSQ